MVMNATSLAPPRWLQITAAVTNSALHAQTTVETKAIGEDAFIYTAEEPYADPVMVERQR